ncbi:MAG: mandelate racemase/muconate lactonizing enzyme family protein [Candidatus Limnocylindrales bacterium]
MSAGGAAVGAEAIRVRVPFRRPIVTSVGSWSRRESWIIRIYDATGAVGVGEAALDIDAGEVAVSGLARLVGDTVDLVRGDHRLPTADEFEAAGAVGRALRCAFDSALLDLGMLQPTRIGVAAAPGAPRSVPVNATIGFREVNETAAAARAAVAAGFGTLKLKAGPERDTRALVERVAAVREAVGPETRLRLDVNGAWDVVTARARIAAVAPYGLEYVEQPVAAGDPSDLAAVREGSPVPIAADEAVFSLAAACELLASRAADVLVVKPARVGGPSAAWEIAALAAALGVPVVVSSLFETGVGLAAALATAAGLPAVGRGATEIAHGLATAELAEADLLARAPRVVQGRMIVPQGPGLGIVLDEEALRRYAVEWLGRRP